jgi:energy-coupling factor transporter ATP-binding protein EcfA2
MSNLQKSRIIMPDVESSTENPFCTRCVRPGAVPYFFPQGLAIEDLLDKLSRNRWTGEIVGPHGSGKSTLLACLIAAIERTGRQTASFELHDGQRGLPRGWRRKIESAAQIASVIVAVDGYEQLNAWNRFRLKRYCRRRNLGLLVTSHASVGLPEIFRTFASLETTRKIVELLMQKERITISGEIIEDLFARHGANIRELLFDLYDIFERQRNKPEK